MIIVLVAALLHAVWNGLVKASHDRSIVLALISLGHVGFGIVLAILAPIPAVESWPYIVVSTLIHWGYYYLLYHAYRLGDLSLVYPISRGMAPVLIAIGAQILAGESLPLMAWIGVLVVSSGILLLSRRAVMSALASKAIGTAVATGICISAYSITDGLGVREAETVLGYVGWLFISEIFVVGFIFIRRGREILAVSASVWCVGLLGGLISATAYGMVIYAKSLTYLALVSTLRETSVIFAALIGIVFLKERPWKPRLVAASIVVLGVVVMSLAT